MDLDSVYVIARALIDPDATFTFDGLGKYVRCCLLELRLNDTETGSILGMTGEMVRHHGRRASTMGIARSCAKNG